MYYKKIYEMNRESLECAESSKANTAYRDIKEDLPTDRLSSNSIIDGDSLGSNSE